jgi:hypothetical protein
MLNKEALIFNFWYLNVKEAFPSKQICSPLERGLGASAPTPLSVKRVTMTTSPSER